MVHITGECEDEGCGKSVGMLMKPNTKLLCIEHQPKKGIKKHEQIKN